MTRRPVLAGAFLEARNIATIIDAALGLFSSRPDVTMTDVARAAEVGRVTLYAHFPPRDALLEAVLDRVIGRAEQELAAICTEGSADEVLTCLLRSSWQPPVTRAATGGLRPRA